MQRVVWTLRLMRNVYDSKLPAEVWHFPDERPDPDSPLVRELRRLGADIKEAAGSVRDTSRTKNVGRLSSVKALNALTFLVPQVSPEGSRHRPLSLEGGSLPRFR